jgi:hypothetical protein
LRTHAYDELFEVVPGVAATFFEAGRILGSAGIALEITERDHKNRLVFSGDIGGHTGFHEGFGTSGRWFSRQSISGHGRAMRGAPAGRHGGQNTESP